MVTHHNFSALSTLIIFSSIDELKLHEMLLHLSDSPLLVLYWERESKGIAPHVCMQCSYILCVAQNYSSSGNLSSTVYLIGVFPALFCLLSCVPFGWLSPLPCPMTHGHINPVLVFC
ncbi:hypothetical protein SAY87_001298 [Trapa incisa]|uniref:Uncharacterized protein n=1 Tax=Trapa incisa TaxID=236973 RepID=A0AAN7GPC0_9MYRT|nr:hypothetical protein SAY87_001298 [Trapa incisa]